VDLATAREMRARHPLRLRRAAHAVRQVEGDDDYINRVLLERIRDAYEDAWEIEGLPEASSIPDARAIAYPASAALLAAEGAVADPSGALGTRARKWSAFAGVGEDLADTIEAWLAATESEA